MMRVVAARLFMLVALTIHAFWGWSAVTLTGLAPERPAGLTMSDGDACGGSCCCLPKACPCLHAPAPDESEPIPASPPRSDRPEIPKIAPSMRGAGLSVASSDSGAACRIEGALTGRPMGDLSRRVQQLQCVWRT